MIQIVETQPLPETDPAGSQGVWNGRAGQPCCSAKRQEDPPADEATQSVDTPPPISWPRVLPGL
jgi:hypothetical protein